jgi:malonate transporter and related proteins
MAATCWPIRSLRSRVMGVSFAWGRWVQRKSLPLAAFSALGMSNSNSGFIGYPIAVQVLGAGPAAVALSLNVVIENLLIIPLALIIADSGVHGGEGGRHWWSVLKQSLAAQARNPFILAVVAGFVVSLSGLPVPEPLARSIGMLAAAAIGVALFVVGGSLVDIPLKGMAQDVTAIALGKLILHPAAVALAVWVLLPDDPVARTAAVALAAAPMLSIYPILAQKYGLEGFCAAALLLTTVLSFVTISVTLWLLGPELGWALGPPL